jgi:hypothetical protein
LAAKAFPPSGKTVSFEGLDLNDQPVDLLLQIIEYLSAREKVGNQAEARYLWLQLQPRIREIKAAPVGKKGGS